MSNKRGNNFKDITGKRFNRLVVQEFVKTESNKKHTLWKCLCDCGNVVIVRSSNLRMNTTKSCGCLGQVAVNRIDLTGRRFGRLLVIGYSKTVGKVVFWKCQCDCWAITNVRSQLLRTGVTTSCGCYQKEIASKLFFKHGLSKTSLYETEQIRKRRAMKLQATDGTVTPEYIQELLNSKFGCSYCGSREKLTIDHVESLNKDGQHSVFNIIPCCHKCNSSKKDTPLVLWIEKNPQIFRQNLINN
jgi:hypothetical protein